MGGSERAYGAEPAVVNVRSKRRSSVVTRNVRLPMGRAQPPAACPRSVCWVTLVKRRPSTSPVGVISAVPSAKTVAPRAAVNVSPPTRASRTCWRAPLTATAKVPSLADVPAMMPSTRMLTAGAGRAGCPGHVIWSTAWATLPRTVYDDVSVKSTWFCVGDWGVSVAVRASGVNWRVESVGTIRNDVVSP